MSADRICDDPILQTNLDFRMPMNGARQYSINILLMVSGFDIPSKPAVPVPP